MATETNTSNNNVATRMKPITHWPGRGVAAGVVMTSFCLASAVPARADDPIAACIGANERSLDLRKQGKLIEARRELASCAVSTCPEVVQQACGRRIAEISSALPSVVFDLKDGTGQPIAGVQVSIDGRPPVPVGVTAVTIDPGSHVLRFEVAGQVPVQRNVGFLEGEKEKRVSVVIGGGEEKHVAHLVISSDEAATVVVDRQTVARGRLDAELSVGPHDIEVTEAGKVPYKAQVELREGETRTLSIALEDERRGTSLWPWIAGSVAVAAGAAIGGYFLFKPQDQTLGVPPGKTASLQLSLSGR
jgi:hypothetical protein